MPTTLCPEGAWWGARYWLTSLLQWQAHYTARSCPMFHWQIAVYFVWKPSAPIVHRFLDDHVITFAPLLVENNERCWLLCLHQRCWFLWPRPNALLSTGGLVILGIVLFWRGLMLLNRCAAVSDGSRWYSCPGPRARILLRFYPSSVAV